MVSHAGVHKLLASPSYSPGLPSAEAIQVHSGRGGCASCILLLESQQELQRKSYLWQMNDPMPAATDEARRVVRRRGQRIYDEEEHVCWQRVHGKRMLNESAGDRCCRGRESE
jgi:hypothetical protein